MPGKTFPQVCPDYKSDAGCPKGYYCPFLTHRNGTVAVTAGLKTTGGKSALDLKGYHHLLPDLRQSPPKPVRIHHGTMDSTMKGSMNGMTLRGTKHVMKMAMVIGIPPTTRK